MSTIYLETTALAAAHLDHPHRALVADEMRRADLWASSAITIVEALALVDRLLDEPVLRRDLEDLLRATWDRVAIVPLDGRCIDRAAQLVRDQPVRLADALHLAAADRLPRPVRYVTFDPVQIPIALALRLDVVSA